MQAEDRGVKAGSICRVDRRADAFNPAEISFLTNPEDRRARATAVRERLAEALYRGVRNTLTDERSSYREKQSRPKLWSPRRIAARMIV